MLRVLLTIVLPLVLPTAAYLLWVGTFGGERGLRVRWATVPWVWLIGGGAVLLAIVLFVVTVHFGAPQEGVYVPPRWEGGRIVPGHMEPRPSR
jgi:Family of unknown function (DUF6111)